MAAVNLESRRVQRLRLACLLVQIAVVEWALHVLFAPSFGWFAFRFGGVSALCEWFGGVLLAAGTLSLVLLLIATGLLFRELKRLRARLAAMLIYNVLLLAVLRNTLVVMNGLWARLYGEKLVVEDPLRLVVEVIPGWLGFGIWLAMIIGGTMIARDLNARFQGFLMTLRRLRTLFVAALLAWLSVVARPFLSPIVFESLLARHHDNPNLYFGLATAFEFLALLPALVLFIMLFLTLRKVRRNVRDIEMPRCPACGYALHRGLMPCPECGWTASAALTDPSGA